MEPTQKPQEDAEMPKEANSEPASPPPHPQVAPPKPETPNNPAHHAENNPTTIILGWLTYAFWGWMVFSLSFLTAMVIGNFVYGSTDNEFVPYAIAAILILLPISAICDILFSRHEPEKKTGGMLLVMIIHAVLFALFSIGALIAAAFSLVLMFTESGENKAAQVALYSSLIIFIMYAAVLLRTLNPPKLPFIRRFFTIFMVVTVGLLCLLGIIGPVNNARQTRDDRLIESNLYQVQSSIDDYARTNNELPTDLDKLSFNGDAQTLVERNLVKYTPDTKQATILRNSSSSSTYGRVNLLENENMQDLYQDQTFYYTLCVNFKRAAKENSYYRSPLDDDDGYSTFLNMTGHKAGENCYKLKTDRY